MIHFDPGSFKDPGGRVFLHGVWACRTLSPQARGHFEQATRAGLIDRLIGDQLLLDTALVQSRSLGLDPSEVGDVILRQPRIAVPTYAYEWSFEMLRDAALVTLRTLSRALEAGFVLKDAPSFNILFDGTQPRLIDAPSIEPYQDGQIWAGYAQFCRAFLFPLLLASYRDFRIQPLMRGHFGELPAIEAAKLFGWRDYLRPGVLKDVIFQASLDRRFAGSQAAVKQTTAGQHYPKALFVGNVARLTALIEQLPSPPQTTEWSAYDRIQSYTDDDRATKAAFVDRVVRAAGSCRVADLGANIGEYSDIVLKAGASVIAVDIDPRAIDRLYRSHAGVAPLTPVVTSLLNPTPALGWGLRERSALLDRLGSDRFLALALLHHLRITGGVPLDAIVSQLFAIAPEGIIEWVDKSDAMVTRMLSLRPDVYTDYTWPTFEATLKRCADVIAVEQTHGGRRRLCHVRARRVA